MKENVMAGSKWRMVQVFLSLQGVSEVEVDLDSGDVRCYCPAFTQRGSCKHTRHVVEKMKDNGGTYPLKVSSRAPQNEASRAHLDRDEFREFVLKYGKVEVL